MSWYDDINIAYRKLTELVDVPPEKEEEVKKILESVWRAATYYDPKWDAD